MAVILWSRIVLTIVYVGLGHVPGLFLDQMSDGSGCSVPSMLCPPMCQQRDSRGCIKCDCNNFNPAMPLNTNTGTGSNPANPLQGAGIPGSTGCDTKWMNCACTPSVDAGSGCLVCNCGQTSMPEVTTSGTIAPKMTSLSNPVTNHVTTGSSGIVTSYVPSNPATTAMKTTYLPTTTTIATTATTTTTTKAQTTPTAPTTKMTFNTQLPNIVTTPAPSSATSLPPTTTTQAAFVCPGIFNCSLDCYAGFVMDSSGCPKCQCAPVPTDLP